MEKLPPKGRVSLTDLRKLYNLMGKHIYNSQAEDVVYRVWEDMVFSLQDIQKWYKEVSKGEELKEGSVEAHLADLYEAKNIDNMFMAIDNCLNDYHKIGPFLGYIVNADFERVNAFLDEMRDKRE